MGVIAAREAPSMIEPVRFRWLRDDSADQRPAAFDT